MWDKKAHWFDYVYTYVFLGIAIAGGPILNLLRIFEINRTIKGIIMFVILIIQFICLILGIISCHKNKKYKRYH